jgi:hypothetical protein
MSALFEVSGMIELSTSIEERSFALAHKDTATEEVQELEDIFAIDPLAFRDAGLTVKQAVHYYNLSPKTIKERIKRGEIPAVSMPGRKGLKWRIYPDGVPEGCTAVAPETVGSASDCADSGSPETNCAPDTSANGRVSTTHSPGEVCTPSICTPDSHATRELLVALRDMQARLEAAAYRNGYLEAQLASLRERMALLTDNHPTRSPSGAAGVPRTGKPWRQWFGELFSWQSQSR